MHDVGIPTFPVTHMPNVSKPAKGGEIWQKQRLNSFGKFAAQNVMTMQP